MKDKHKEVLRMAAQALKVGRCDKRLADSLLGIIASSEAEAQRDFDKAMAIHDEHIERQYGE